MFDEDQTVETQIRSCIEYEFLLQCTQMVIETGDNMKYKTEFEMAKTAAKVGGDVLLDAMTRTKVVLSSEGRDIKLQADRDSEDAILAVLESSGHPVLAEESGEHGETDTSGLLWVIDPLDGTVNFYQGLPICCVSVGLMLDGEPLLGVIYDFNHDDWYSGIVGEGAWLNDEPMHVSEVTEQDRAILTTGFPAKTDFSDGAVQQFVNRAQSYKKVRMMGSAAMSLAYVASGAMDVYTEDDILLWDVAAGAAIVQGAGGHVQILDSDRQKWARKIRAASCVSLLR